MAHAWVTGVWNSASITRMLLADTAGGVSAASGVVAGCSPGMPGSRPPAWP